MYTDEYINNLIFRSFSLSSPFRSLQRWCAYILPFKRAFQKGKEQGSMQSLFS